MKNCINQTSVYFALMFLLVVISSASAQQLKPTEIIYSRLPSGANLRVSADNS